MVPHPITDEFINSLPSTGIVVVGLGKEADVAEALGADDVVKELASELEVFAVVNGSDLAEKTRAAIQQLITFQRLLRVTFRACDEKSGFDDACAIYHRRKSELHLRTHPKLSGHNCPEPFCEDKDN